MPLSTALFLACMTAMRILCFAAAALFVLLAVRAQFDAEVALPWTSSLLAAVVFVVSGFACGFMRDAIRRRSGGN